MLKRAVNRRRLGLSLVIVVITSVALSQVTHSNASSTPRDLPANQADNHFLQLPQQQQSRQPSHQTNKPTTQNIVSDNETTQHKIQQNHHQREISCEELNLIVSAQISPFLNLSFNAANKFIECQRIDPTLASKLSSSAKSNNIASKAPMLAKTTTTTSEQNLEPITIAALPSLPANSANLSPPGLSSPGALPSKGFLELSDRSSNSSQVRQQLGQRFHQNQTQAQPQLQRHPAGAEFNVGSAVVPVSAVALASAATIEKSGPRHEEQLHFGAKVAISVLIVTILLVTSATLVDLNQQQSDNSCCFTDLSRQPSSASKQQRQASQQLYQHQFSVASFHQNQDQLRDQRSPSLSSSSSSSIFCSSANSVASACIPILGGHQRCSSSVTSRKQQHKQRVLQQQEQEARCYNNAWFEFNLQKRRTKLQEQQCNNQNVSMPQIEVSLAEANNTAVNNSQEQQLETVNSIRQREENIFESVMKAERWRNCNNTQFEDDTSMRSVGGGITHSRTTSFWLNKSLLKQLFLAFSLRHSASLIFYQSEANNTRNVDKTSRFNRSESNVFTETILAGNQPIVTQTTLQPRQINGHRARVSSISNNDIINQTIIPTSCDNNERHQQPPSYVFSSFSNYNSSSDCDESPNSGRQQQQPVLMTHSQLEQANESIDSLHGLKFLSMIWIIVVHSYSLATRWSFFTDNSTPTNIYTSVASQLLSNGTFACDSFFFTGGFLLAYLAFPSSASTSSPPAQTSSTAPKEAPTAPLVSNSPTLTAQSSQVEPQFQVVPPAPQQQQQTISQAAVNNLTVKDCKVKIGGKQAGNLSYEEGTESNRYSSPSTTQCCCCYFCSASYKQVRTNSSTKCSSNTCSPVTSQLVVAMVPHENQGDNNNYERNLQQQQQLNLITTINSNKNGQVTLNEVASDSKNSESVKNFSHGDSNLLKQAHLLNTNEFTFKRLICNLIHRYIRMMPLMMAIIGLSATLLRYLGEGQTWDDSTIMFDKWCRKNWWINSLFLHNFVNRENMCLSHSWYSAVDIQLYLIGQIILFVLYRNRRIGLLICCTVLIAAPVITATLTLLYNLPAVPLTISTVSEQSLNFYYGEIYIKPYCRAAPYLIGILLAYLMRTTSLGQVRLKRWQVITGWTASLGVLLGILLAMQPAMNGQPPSELVSALYSALSRPFWACATGWMIFACITKHGGIFDTILSAKCFVPFSRLTYPAFLIHPIVMAIFYGSRPERSYFSHYLMLYLILGHIVITYSSAFVLSALFELPLLSVERVIKRALSRK